jgi:ubiquitin carboxyl-terminal hydrolase 34
LKRFAFDFETFLRKKLNNFYEMWHELDLEPYSKQGFSKREGKKLENEKPSDYFKYKLVGVLVHTGSAQGKIFLNNIFF